MQIFDLAHATLNAKSDRRTPKTNFQLIRATLNAKSDRRTPKTVVKCKFPNYPRNPFGIPCVSDVQNCGKTVIFYLVVASWREQLVRNCGEMHILGRTRTSWGGLLPRVSVFSVCVCVCVFSVCVCVRVCFLCVFLCVFSLCVFSLCFLSVCSVCVFSVCVFSLSVFSVCVLCVFSLRFLCVFSLCVFSVCVCGHSIYKLF